MSILIKNATIVQENGPHHFEKKDILIEKGIITKIAKSIKVPAKKTVEGNDLHVSVGWFDIGSHSGEPGFEHRETINSLRSVAAAGGFTNLAIFPNTYPPHDNSTALKIFQFQLGNSPVKIYPIGAVSKNIAGVDIAEFIDMHEAGAIAFSDGLNSIADNGLLMRALQYAKSFNGLIIHHPHDHQIAGKGQMHEGKVSTSLGLTGIPAMAELSDVERDISLLNYTESNLLIHLISAKESVAAIKQAKKSSKQLFSSVSYLNLIANDEALSSFESNFKVQPPLRENIDRKNLVKGIKDGTIDIIASNHFPLEEDLKKDAFQYTVSGAIGLQVLFPALWENLHNELELSSIIKCLNENPRRILGIEMPKIDKNQKADITIFDLDERWEYNQDSNCSKSHNSPYLDQEFGSKVVGTIHGTFKHFN